MISTLDRHLLWQFARNAALVTAATVAVFLLLDVLLAFHVLAAKGADLWAKATYFACRIPGLLNFALPVSALVSTLATVAPMLRRGEFTALGSAGINLRRATRSLLLGCLVIGAIDLAIADLATPPTTALGLAVQDRIEGSGRGGRTWRTSAGTTWFATGTDLVGTAEPHLYQVVAATGGTMLLADRITWRQGAWQLSPGSVLLEVRDGGQQLTRPPPGLLPPVLSLDIPPDELYRRILPRYTMTSIELLARGELADLATVWSRALRLVLPLLAAMTLLAVFVRFANRDRVAVAVVEAVVASLIPTGLLIVTGISADTTPGGPAIAVIAGALLAAIQPLWLWLRWRL